MNTVAAIEALKNHFVCDGYIEWIGVRPARGVAMRECERARLQTGRGIEGDRAGQRPGGKRQLTLIQAEYLPLLRTWLGQPDLHWRQLRRNVVVRGINLNALLGHKLRLGDAMIEVSGLCHPCKRLEEQLGFGVFNVMRGHGGLTARVLTDGAIRCGDKVTVVDAESLPV